MDSPDQDQLLPPCLETMVAKMLTELYRKHTPELVEGLRRLILAGEPLARIEAYLIRVTPSPSTLNDLLQVVRYMYGNMHPN